MDVTVLIDAIFRQPTVPIAQLATSAGKKPEEGEVRVITYVGQTVIETELSGEES